MAQMIIHFSNLPNKAALKLLADEHDHGTTPRFAVCFGDLTGFKAINTRATGMQLCEHLPRLDDQGDKIAVVRSVTSPTVRVWSRAGTNAWPALGRQTSNAASRGRNPSARHA